jgi:hypothetical protein
MARIVGYRKIDYKKNKGQPDERRILAVKLQIVRPPSRREKAESTGKMVEEVYIPSTDDLYSSIDFSKFLDKEVNLDFEVDGNYKYLVGVELVG